MSTTRMQQIAANMNAHAQTLARAKGLGLHKHRTRYTHLKCRVDTVTTFDPTENMTCIHITLSTPCEVQADYQQDAVDRAFNQHARS